MDDVLGIADDAFPLLQSAQLVRFYFRDDFQNLALADHFHRDARLERLVEDPVDILPELGSGDSHSFILTRTYDLDDSYVLLGELHQRLPGQHCLGILRGELLRLRGVIHGTELRPAHGTERGVLETLLGERFVMHGLGGFRIE